MSKPQLLLGFSSLSISSSVTGGVTEKLSLTFLPKYVLNGLADFGIFFSKFGPTSTKYLLKVSAILKGSVISSLSQ